jgi:hypothetical protein
MTKWYFFIFRIKIQANNMIYSSSFCTYVTRTVIPPGDNDNQHDKHLLIAIIQKQTFLMPFKCVN